MVVATRDAKGMEGVRFAWVPFYETLAHALLTYAHDRAPLVHALLNIGAPESKLDYLTHDQFADGRTGPLEDVDPFTALAVFNRSSGYGRRTEIAAGLARFLHVDLPPPTDFAGVPTVDPRSSWYFGFAKDRGAGDIDARSAPAPWSAITGTCGQPDRNTQFGGRRQPFRRYHLNSVLLLRTLSQV